MAHHPMPPLEPGTIEVAGWSLYHRHHRPPNRDGPPTVHIHGFGISGSYLEPTAALLASGSPTFVPDLPGTGRSTGAMGGLTITRLADVVAAYCQAVGVDRACFVGNSLGCSIIIELAASRPELVDRLALVSPAGGPHNQPLARAVGQLLRVAPREPTSLLRVALPDYLSFGPVRGLSLFRGMTRYPVVDRLAELEAPTLIVVGDRDPLVDIDRLLSAVSVVDQRTVVSIPGAHALNHSHPEEVAALVSEFFEGRPIGGAEIEGVRLLAGS